MHAGVSGQRASDEGAMGIRSLYGKLSVGKQIPALGQAVPGTDPVGKPQPGARGGEVVSPLCPPVLPLLLVQGTPEPFPR